MTFSRTARVVLFAAAMAGLAFLAPTAAFSQKGNNKKKEQPAADSSAILRPAPRPKRPDLPPSTLPIEFVKGERIALVGNSTAERMNLFGHFETLLHLRHHEKELVIRNFGRPAEEVSVHQRSADYTKIDDPLAAFGADTYICFFGFNESFQGPEGLEKFKKDYEAFIDDYSKRYPRDDAGSKSRFVLISPIAFEETGDRFLPDGKKENANLKLYTEAVKAVAKKRGLAFVDLFTYTKEEFEREPGMQLTINGVHVNDAGDRFASELLDHILHYSDRHRKATTATYEKLRAAVNDKSFVHHQDYRMVNGWYVYGGRRTYDTETFPREYSKIRAMAAVRDRYVWDITQGKEVAARPDDSKTGDLFVPPTRFGDPRQKYSEADDLRYLTPDEFIKSCTVAPGTEIQLFADETMFPDLAKPVQLNFDNKGRLWAACMPNYPQWKPGDPKPNDRLLILEDTNADGNADKCKVFYDQLHCPTGFEFFNGGVLVIDQPRLLWLKDTNGDDQADVVVHLLDGWATDDTHHTCGAFEWGPGGVLHMLEGIATSTTLETPWGPHRSQGSGGCYVLDPRSLKVRQFALPGMYNMWCYVFDDWGQGIVGDGTTPNQTWDTPLSGAQYSGRKGLNFILPNGVRPNLGNEWLVSRNLPDDLQRQFTYACVIQMNGLTRYEVKDDGAGYMGKRLPDLIQSSDKHFRPADPQIGPDGALWFGDWANALIGHMQYSQRDPNRDHTRGRIYRLVGKDKPLVKPVTQFGKSVPELLEQLREYEWRTRYRVRRELRDRPTEEVVAAVKAWAGKVAATPEYRTDAEKSRLLCEALWVLQGHHAVDADVLNLVLGSVLPQARAAAVRVVADDRDYIASAFEHLTKAAADEHPRVRTEALRGLSFYSTPESMQAVLAVAKKPLDYWTRYTLEATLGANEAVWRPEYLAGKLDKDNAEAGTIMAGILASSKAGGAAAPHLRVLLNTELQSVEVKNKALTELAKLKGSVNRGREVFVRTCIACHKVGNGEGQEYGPNLAGLATRQNRMKIIESVLDPNAELDAKFASTRVVTFDGKTIVGLVVNETKKDLTIFDGKEKRTILLDDIEARTVLKQSSMPEGQASAMSPAEFLDLIEYLAAQNQKQ